MNFEQETRPYQGYMISLARVFNTHHWSVWIETPDGEHVFALADSYVPGQKLATSLVNLHQAGALVDGAVLAPEGAST